MNDDDIRRWPAIWAMYENRGHPDEYWRMWLMSYHGALVACGEEPTDEERERLDEGWGQVITAAAGPLRWRLELAGFDWEQRRLWIEGYLEDLGLPWLAGDAE